MYFTTNNAPQIHCTKSYRCSNGLSGHTTQLQRHMKNVHYTMYVLYLLYLPTIYLKIKIPI